MCTHVFTLQINLRYETLHSQVNGLYNVSINALWSHLAAQNILQYASTTTICLGIGQIQGNSDRSWDWKAFNIES